MSEPEEAPHVGDDLDEDVDDIDIILGSIKELNRERKRLVKKQRCAPGFTERMTVYQTDLQDLRECFLAEREREEQKRQRAAEMMSVAFITALFVMTMFAWSWSSIK